MKKVIFLGMLVTFLIVFKIQAQETMCHKYVTLNPTQEPSQGPRCRLVGDTFYLDGAVTDEMYYELRDHASGAKVIELNSYGGIVEAGYRIAELVHQRGIRTNVRRGAKCASACTLIFQAGVIRTAHPLVRFLYHGARLSSSWVDFWLETRIQTGRDKARELLAQQFLEVKAETEKFFRQLVFYGADPKLIETYQALPEASDWFEDGNFIRTENWIISVPKLIHFNVVQGFDLRNSVPE